MSSTGFGNPHNSITRPLECLLRSWRDVKQDF
jgi:hypothetical protein